MAVPLEKQVTKSTMKEKLCFSRDSSISENGINLFHQMNNKEELVPDFEYVIDENEEEKNNGRRVNQNTIYTGVMSAGFKDLLLKPEL